MPANGVCRAQAAARASLVPGAFPWLSRLNLGALRDSWPPLAQHWLDFAQSAQRTDSTPVGIRLRAKPAEWVVIRKAGVEPHRNEWRERLVEQATGHSGSFAGLDSMTPTDPIPFSSCSASGATVVWRHRGRLKVTLITKATFALAPGGMTPLAPEPVARAERSEPGAGLVQPDDLAPFLSRADVWVAGERRSGGALPRVARLAVLRSGVPVLDKRIVVAGEQGDPPFTAFAPLSKRWPVRARLLKATPSSQLEGNAMVIPDDLDWRYFQAAPTDQQTLHLDGTEVLVIENLHAPGTKLEARLPEVRTEASLIEAGCPAVSIRMVLDTLVIDAERQICNLVFRGSAPLVGPLNQARIERRFHCVEVAANVPTKSPSAPPELVGETRTIDAAVVAGLREKYALPFERAVSTSVAPAQAASPPASAAPPNLSTGHTAIVTDEDASALRKRFATPFKKTTGAPVGSEPSPVLPPPAAKAASGTVALSSSVGAPQLGSTQALPKDQAAALRAQPAAFRGAPSRPAPPPAPPAPKAPPMAVAAPVAKAAPVAVSSKAVPVAERPVASPIATLGVTAAFDESEVAAIRAEFATPFEHPFLQRARASAPAPALTPRTAAPRGPRTLGETSEIDPEKVRALQARYAVPFETSNTSADTPEEPRAEPEPKRVGSPGACFLAALAEHGVKGLFDLGVNA